APHSACPGGRGHRQSHPGSISKPTTAKSVMIFAEDPRSYEQRQLDEALRRDEEIRAIRAKRDHPLVELIFDVMHENECDLPLRTITIPNLVVKKLDPKNRAEREEMKKLVLHRLCALLKVGRLERVGRHDTTLPRTDEKYQAYLRSIEQTIATLPEPRL